LEHEVDLLEMTVKAGHRMYMDHLHPVSTINFGKCVPNRNRDKLVLRLCFIWNPLMAEVSLVRKDKPKLECRKRL